MRWHARLVYPTREQLTRQRCWAHAYSEQTNAVELRVALQMCGAPIADPDRDPPPVVADVPLPVQGPPPKALNDPNKKIAKIDPEQIRARERKLALARENERWWHEFQTWDGR
jgi:hypothetical protein